jgi:hypothetical protein
MRSRISGSGSRFPLTRPTCEIMNPAQLRLFESRPALPPGFKYQPDLLSPAQERELVARFAGLPFKEFECQGFLGKRRVVSFGWQYDFNDRQLRRTQEIPDFLLPVRDTAASSPAWRHPSCSRCC